MELQQLKYFKTVVETGKISSAAEQLFISAPALSTSISRLEKELGMPLFTRTNNRILLNKQGQIFLKYVQQVFASLDSAKEELEQSLLNQKYNISIFTVGTALWTDLIASFAAEHPHITLSCTSVMPAALSEKGLPDQCSFLLASESCIPKKFEEEMDSIFLLENSPMVMVNTAHPLAKESAITVDMLSNETILMSKADLPLHQRILKLFEDSYLPIPTYNAYSFFVRQKMVSLNVGVSFTGKYSSYSSYPNVTYIPLVDPYGPWKNRLYWRHSHRFTESEQIFYEFANTFFTDLH